MRTLSRKEIALLESAACSAEDWSKVMVHDDFDAQYVKNVDFYGNVSLGSNTGFFEVTPGFQKHCGIRNAVLKDVEIGNNCLIENVRGYINNYYIGDDCLLSNIHCIETTADASFGEGTVISVLNEVGDGNVMIFDGLSSQLASLMVK